MELFSGGRSFELDLPDVGLGVVANEGEGPVVPRDTELRPNDADPLPLLSPGRRRSWSSTGTDFPDGPSTGGSFIAAGPVVPEGSQASGLSLSGDA